MERFLLDGGPDTAGEVTNAPQEHAGKTSSARWKMEAMHFLLEHRRHTLRSHSMEAMLLWCLHALYVALLKAYN